MRNLSKGKGIVLRKVAYGESDLILTLIMDSGDRRSMLARGARKSQRRFAGGILDPMSYIQVGFSQGSGLSTLNDANPIEAFDGLRSSYAKMETALGIISLIDKICQEGDVGSADLFNILGNSLKSLETTENFKKLELQVKIKILNQQGSLHFESWMDPYLRHSLKDLHLIDDTDDIEAKNMMMRERMQDYLTGVIGVRDSQLARNHKSILGGRD